MNNNELSMDEKHALAEFRRKRDRDNKRDAQIWRGYELERDLRAYRDWLAENPGKTPVHPAPPILRPPGSA